MVNDYEDGEMLNNIDGGKLENVNQEETCKRDMKVRKKNNKKQKKEQPIFVEKECTSEQGEKLKEEQKKMMKKEQDKVQEHNQKHDIKQKKEQELGQEDVEHEVVYEDMLMKIVLINMYRHQTLLQKYQFNPSLFVDFVEEVQKNF